MLLLLEVRDEVFHDEIPTPTSHVIHGSFYSREPCGIKNLEMGILDGAYYSQNGLDKKGILDRSYYLDNYGNNMVYPA